MSSTIAPSRAAISAPVDGSSGGSWRDAHQTTPATARSEMATPAHDSGEPGDEEVRASVLLMAAQDGTATRRLQVC